MLFNELDGFSADGDLVAHSDVAQIIDGLRMTAHAGAGVHFSGLKVHGERLAVLIILGILEAVGGETLLLGGDRQRKVVRIIGSAVFAADREVIGNVGVTLDRIHNGLFQIFEGIGGIARCVDPGDINGYHTRIHRGCIVRKLEGLVTDCELFTALDSGQILEVYLVNCTGSAGGIASDVRTVG